MASEVSVSVACDGTDQVATITGSHADWGGFVTVAIDGESITFERPAGHDEYTDGRWDFVGTYRSDDVGSSLSWIDDSYGGVPSADHLGSLDAAVCAAPETTTTTEPYCAEDDPCFDCVTMGNRVCGPVTTVAEAVEPLPVVVVDVTTTMVALSHVPVPVYVVPDGVATVADAGTTTSMVGAVPTLPATGSETAVLVSAGLGFLLTGALTLRLARRAA